MWVYIIPKGDCFSNGASKDTEHEHETAVAHWADGLTVFLKYNTDLHSLYLLVYHQETGKIIICN